VGLGNVVTSRTRQRHRQEDSAMPSPAGLDIYITLRPSRLSSAIALDIYIASQPIHLDSAIAIMTQ
jgi:hypothetical protein